MLGDFKGYEITVNKVLQIFRKTGPISSREHTIPDLIVTNWLSIKTIINKKKDIYWRLFHRSLPLSYRLTYIELPEAGFCPWYTEEPQTPEHFTIDCSLSEKIWEIVYSFLNINELINYPSTLKEMFSGSSAQNAS